MDEYRDTVLFGISEMLFRAEWQESKHPRDPDGKFNGGGGGGGSSKTKGGGSSKVASGGTSSTKSRLDSAASAHKSAYEAYKKAKKSGDKTAKKKAFEEYKKAQQAHTKALSEHYSAGKKMPLGKL